MGTGHDPFDLPAQEKAEKATRLKRKLAEETEGADIRWLMGSRRGRRIVWRLLEQAGVFRSTFSPELALMAFNEGSRNAGLRMLSLVTEHCAELFPTMLKEHSRGRTDPEPDARSDSEPGAEPDPGA